MLAGTRRPSRKIHLPNAVKFLFVSPEALSLDLAYKIVQERHEVKFSILGETEKDVGDGFVEKADKWEDLVP